MLMHDYIYVNIMHSLVTNKCLVLRKSFFYHLQTYLNTVCFEQMCVEQTYFRLYY